MIDKLELLLHLARERHFGKAAQAAGVSQPTLSSAVKSLEEQLGVVIVERGSRFGGFTIEGERVLAWARRLTADVRAMRAELAATAGDLSGELRLGAIPTALSAASELTVPFQRAFARITFKISSMASEEILRKLANLELDVGISYIDSEPLRGFRAVSLYEERYALLLPPDGMLNARPAVTWHQAGKLPLCLLSSDMQNRRLIDQHLKDAGTEAACTVESNSILVLYAHVRTGQWASILPVNVARELEVSGRLRAIPLTEPDVRHTVGLILPDRDTQTPIVTRFVETARRTFSAGNELTHSVPPKA